MFQQVRKINPTRRSVSGNYPFRGDTSIPYESSLERDFIIKQEFDNKVTQLIAQPVSIPFSANNRTYFYTPDYLCLFNNSMNKKGILVEIKPEKEWQAHWRKWLPKWKAASRWAHEQNFTFHIYDETRIRDVYFDNIKLVNAFKILSFSHSEIDYLFSFLHDGNQCISSFLALFATQERNHQFRLILFLLANHLLVTDFNQPINEHSIISLVQES
ncbi:TnsA endonuclease N-terminal domain-containing protein [Neisseria chenwenguii]|uniref:TnsA endonuclease N-terminal domain-containing protein n=1 Tax=Neisseria chenwenguii TaxID=1853278 RepID=UPI000F4DF327|nr:TnsA endonuclease N-terminal domain-containing protein [Neisseria chenwenguii]ROV53850.1 hypothetical protein EGS38_11795 [Neisseria chenwenguii]